MLNPRHVLPATALVTCLGAAAAVAQLAFDEQPILNIGVFGLGQTALHDMDGVNGPDLVIGTDSASGFTVGVWRNDGAGNFPPELLSPTLACGDAADVAPGDWDGDGLTDILALDKHHATSRICFVRQISAGNWADDGAKLLALNRAGIAACDVNGDARIDILVGNPDAGEVEVFLNDGSGDITAIVVTPYSMGLVSAFTCCDVNADGFPDLAAVSSSEGLLRVRLNDGTGTFGDETLFFIGGGPSAIACSDLDGDGIRDLAVTRQDDDSVVVFLSDGSGGFTIVSGIPAGDQPNGITCGDLDCDGDVDLAVNGLLLGPVRALLNDGTGAGWTLTTLDTDAGGTLKGIHAGEIDGEPGIDIVRMYDSGVAAAWLYYNIGTACGDCVPTPPDLVAWYRGETCLPDDTIGNHDGSIVGFPFCPLWKVGGGALGFDDGTLPTYMTVPNDCALDPGDGDFSVNTWVRAGGADLQPIVTKGGTTGYELALYNGQARVVVCDASLCWQTAGTSLINDGDWHHVAFTMDRGASTVIRLYVDGVLENTTLASVGTVSSPHDLLLGAWPSPTPAFFLGGALDELQVSDRELSAAEIQAIFLVGIPGQCLGTLCDPPFGTCDEETESSVLEAGVQDEFALPAEPATPGAVLAGSCAGGVDFDVTPAAAPVCHTFTDIPVNVIAATLEIRLRAGAAGSVCDDTIALQATGGAPAFGWERRLGAPIGVCPGEPGLRDCPWSPLDTWTFCLDLAALPEASGSTSSLLDAITADGRLDVRVADDTAVDHLRLRLLHCPCPGDASGDGVVDVNDMVMVITDWGPCSDPCPPPCAADFNDDCVVDVNDLVLVFTEWGPCGE